MGAIIFPQSGHVYLDSNVIIYSVEKNSIYWPLPQALCASAKVGKIKVATSSPSLMEVSVGPMKSGNASFLGAYESLLHSPQVRLDLLDEAVLRKAAGLRSTITKLRTPDAIHAASALVNSAGHFISNDDVFRKVPGLSVTILHDLLKP